MEKCNLSEMKVDKLYKVISLNIDDLSIKSLDNIGISKGRNVSLIGAVISDPITIRIEDSRISIRRDLAIKIDVELVKNIENEYKKAVKKDTSKIALVGILNCGKSTLFNKLTKGSVVVGNFPGATVSIHKGYVKIDKGDYELFDLPGIYSLKPDTEEQRLTKTFLANESEEKGITTL